MKIFFKKMITYLSISVVVVVLASLLSILNSQAKEFICDLPENFSDMSYSFILETIEESSLQAFGFFAGLQMKPLLVDENCNVLYKGNSTTMIFNSTLGDLLPVSKKNKIGFIDRNGKLIIKYEYDQYIPINLSISLGKSSYGIVRIGEKYGIIDTKNNKIFPIDYDEIESLYNNYFFLRKANKSIIVEITNNKPSIIKTFNNIGFVDSDFIKKEFLNGFLYYKTGEEYLFKIVNIKTNKNGIIDYKGNIVLPCEYNNIYKCGAGFIVNNDNNIPPNVSYGGVNNHMSGAFDKNGKELIPLMYDRITYGNINYNSSNENSSFIVSLQYKKPTPMSMDCYKYGVISKKGKLILPCKYSLVDILENGDIISGDTYKPSSIRTIAINKIYDKDGKLLLKGSFDVVLGLSDNVIAFLKDGKVSFYHKNTKTIYSSNYNSIASNSYSSNFKVRPYFKVTGYYGKCGLIDNSGKEVLPCVYDEIYTKSRYNKHLFKVKYNNKYGIVDLNNRVVIPLSYKDIVVYNDNFIVARNDNDKVGAIDFKGNILVPFEYSNILLDPNNGFLVEKIVNFDFIRRGYIDNNGKVIIPCDKYVVCEPLPVGYGNTENGSKYNRFWVIKKKLLLDIFLRGQGIDSYSL